MSSATSRETPSTTRMRLGLGQNAFGVKPVPATFRVRAAPPPGAVPARSGAASVTPRRSGTASNTPRKTARAVSVPQANYARGCVGLGDTHRNRYAHRGGSLRGPSRWGWPPARRLPPQAPPALRGRSGCAADPEPGAGTATPRVRHEPRHGTRFGAQRRRPVDRDGPTGRSAPDSERHGPAAKPPGREAPPARTRGEAEGRDGQDDPNAKREYRTGHPKRSGPERNGTTHPTSEERTGKRGATGRCWRAAQRRDTRTVRTERARVLGWRTGGVLGPPCLAPNSRGFWLVNVGDVDYPMVLPEVSTGYLY